MTNRDDGAPWVDQDAAIAALQAHAQAVVLPDWPVFALADSEEAGWLAGAVEQDGTLLRIRLDFRPPDGGERLVVQTQLDDGRQLDLSLVAAQLPESEGQPLRLDGSATGGGDIPWRGTETDVLVDGRAVPGTIHRHGEASAWSVIVRGVLVVVAASAVEMSRPALVRITDLEPYKRQRVLMVERLLSPGAGRPGRTSE